MNDQPNEKNSLTVTELDDRFQHLKPGFQTFLPKGYISFWDVVKSLPYSDIGDKGFERLCYLILLSQGKLPKYFGKDGQPQYAIDVLLSDGKEIEVYQCKNRKSFSINDLQKELKKFKDEWLVEQNLPSPQKYILCVPLSIRETSTSKKWLEEQVTFYAETGIKLEYWDLEFLDETLKSLPDIVAEIFSPKIAERFCGLADWSEDLFCPVTSHSTDRDIIRYLKRKDEKKVYVDENLFLSLKNKLEAYQSLLIQGLPGSGKTFIALTLSELFSEKFYRVFYINLRYEINEDELIRGIKHRLSYPTIFVIDNCQSKYELVENIQNRMTKDKGIRLIYISRTTLTPDNVLRAEYFNFLDEMKESNTIVTISPKTEDFKHIIPRIKPDLEIRNEIYLERLFELTGGDLFLLDELLANIKFEEDIYKLSPEVLFEKVLIRYFNERTLYKPEFTKLTALAQFDVSPLVEIFDDKLVNELPQQSRKLLITADRPPRYFFLHSSLAELICRALIWNQNKSFVDTMSKNLTYLFEKLHEVRPEDFVKDVATFLQNRLKLGTSEEDIGLKTGFLANSKIESLIKQSFGQLPINLVGKILNILKEGDSSVLQIYEQFIEEKITDETILQMMIESSHVTIWDTSNIKYKDWHKILRQQFISKGLMSVIEKLTSIRDFLQLINKLVEEENSSLICAIRKLDDYQINELIWRNIELNLSIETIHFSIREIKKKDEEILKELEKKIGANRFLRLVVNNGSITTLFRVLEYLPIISQERLIAEITDEKVNQLIEKAITSKLSIETIDLRIREIKQKDERLLERLEEKIGTKRLLRLIVNNGSILSLLNIIRRTSNLGGRRLTKEVTSEMINKLIDNTIAAKSSIGTLTFPLREIKRKDKRLFKELEESIEAKKIWELIIANGNLTILSQLTNVLGNNLRRKIIEESYSITVDEWKRLIHQSSFVQACNFVRWANPKLINVINKDLLEEIKPYLQDLIEHSSWEKLNTGTYRLKESLPSSLKDTLLSILSNSLNGIDLDSFRINCFSESVFFMLVYIKLIPTQKIKVEENLFLILPEVSTWYSDENYLDSMRNLLSFISEENKNVNILLHIGNDERVCFSLRKNDTYSIFFYLWTLFSLWMPWRKKQNAENKELNDFAGFLNPRIKVELQTIVHNAVRNIQKLEDLINLLKLIGFLKFYGICNLNNKEKIQLEQKLPSVEELLSQIRNDELGFVSSVFFLLGVECVFDRKIEKAKWNQVSKKYEYYDSPALSTRFLNFMILERIK